jgi:tartrate dehydrogenase/decarboxylase/D-malate dehydrogenase
MLTLPEINTAALGLEDPNLLRQQCYVDGCWVGNPIDAIKSPHNLQVLAHVPSATKSNGLYYSMPFWDERFSTISQQYPDVAADQYHIDILAARFVMSPSRFSVVVGSNLFGDILSDLGPGVTGTIAVAPSGNINPERIYPSMFEPVHGSAPDIAGDGIANPIGQIWSAAMMLEHLGASEAAARIMTAIEFVLQNHRAALTPDIGGKGTTQSLGNAILSAI